MRENGHKCPQRELLREQRRLESKTQRRLCSMAKRVAAVRELTPSLWKMELRCLWTVRGLRKSLWATWALVSPSATSPSTSTSRGLSPPGCSGVEEIGGCDLVGDRRFEGFSLERAYSMARSSPKAPPSATASSQAASPNRERTLAR